MKVDRYLDEKSLSEVLDILEDLYSEESCEKIEENDAEDSYEKKLNKKDLSL